MSVHQPGRRSTSYFGARGNAPSIMHEREKFITAGANNFRAIVRARQRTEMLGDSRDDTQAKAATEA